MEFVLLALSAISIIFFGGIGEYLAEHQHQGANITRLGDAFWWAVVTITTVGYGDYYPVTLVGRLIAVFVMFSGIGIVVVLVGTIAQRRSIMQRIESRLKVRPREETGTATKNKIEGIDKLTIEDVDTLIIMIKSLRTLLEQSNKCSRCGNVYHGKSNFCSNCGLAIT